MTMQELLAVALTDNDKAFRLAAMLKLATGYSGGNKYFAGPSNSDKGVIWESGEQDGVQDECAALRKAIVRAAELVIKSMPAQTDAQRKAAERDHVRIPTSAAEAKAMATVAIAWLRDHAPDELRPEFRA